MSKVTDIVSDIRTIETATSDIQNQLNAKAPIEDILSTAVASATTTTIGTSGSGSTVHITGVTTIASFGVSTTGTRRTLIFDGAMTITQNATSMILPAATSITTVAGDVMEVVCENGALGYWRCTSYVVNSISVTEQKYIDGVTSNIQTQLDSKLGATLAVALNHSKATVASSATTSQIWTALGNQIDWTGTATTTAFPSAPQAGVERTLICAGACSFTADANLLINGVTSGATVTCAAGDQVTVTALSTTQFRLNIITVVSTALNLSGGTMAGAITAIRETRVAMGANDIALNAGNVFTKTISTATTLTISNVLAAGNSNGFILELTNGGAAVVTWFAGVKWAGGTAPTLTAAGVDILGFYSHDGGTTWRGLVMAKDSK